MALSGIVPLFVLAYSHAVASFGICPGLAALRTWSGSALYEARY